MERQVAFCFLHRRLITTSGIWWIELIASNALVRNCIDTCIFAHLLWTCLLYMLYLNIVHLLWTLLCIFIVYPSNGLLEKKTSSHQYCFSAVIHSGEHGMGFHQASPRGSSSVLCDLTWVRTLIWTWEHVLNSDWFMNGNGPCMGHIHIWIFWWLFFHHLDTPQV